VFLVEDGTAVEMTTDTARAIPGVPTGRVLVDGSGVGDVGAVVLRDRQLLADNGVVAVSVAVDASGTVVSGPDLDTRGFVYVRDNEPLLAELRSAIGKVLSERPRPDARPADAPVDREAMSALIRTTVRQFINHRFQRKPMVLSLILEV
jgi:ribonuclease J